MIEEIEGFAVMFNPFRSSALLPGQPLYLKYRADQIQIIRYLLS